MSDPTLTAALEILLPWLPLKADGCEVQRADGSALLRGEDSEGWARNMMEARAIATALNALPDLVALLQVIRTECEKEHAPDRLLRSGPGLARCILGLIDGKVPLPALVAERDQLRAFVERVADVGRDLYSCPVCGALSARPCLECEARRLLGREPPVSEPAERPREG